jgi:hypothetical protein
MAMKKTGRSQQGGRSNIKRDDKGKFISDDRNSSRRSDSSRSQSSSSKSDHSKRMSSK